MDVIDMVKCATLTGNTALEGNFHNINDPFYFGFLIVTVPNFDNLTPLSLLKKIEILGFK